MVLCFKVINNLLFFDTNILWKYIFFLPLNDFKYNDMWSILCCAEMISTSTELLRPPQQWWGRCCSGWEPQVLPQVPSAPQPFLPVCPVCLQLLFNLDMIVTLEIGNLDMLEDGSLNNPTGHNCSLLSRNSEGDVTTCLQVYCASDNKSCFEREKNRPGWSVYMWGYSLQAPRHLASNRWMSV